MTVPSGKTDSIDLAAIEEKLRGAKGKQYWRRPGRIGGDATLPGISAQ